jgi:hypothetical protein
MLLSLGSLEIQLNYCGVCKTLFRSLMESSLICITKIIRDIGILVVDVKRTGVCIVFTIGTTKVVTLILSLGDEQAPLNLGDKLAKLRGEDSDKNATDESTDEERQGHEFSLEVMVSGCSALMG